MEVFVVLVWDTECIWNPVAAFSSLSAAAVYLSGISDPKRHYIQSFHLDCPESSIVSYSYADLVSRGLLEE